MTYPDKNPPDQPEDELDEEFLRIRDWALMELAAVIPFDAAERLLDKLVEVIDEVMAEGL